MHDDPIGDAPDWLGEGLRKALFSYKEGKELNTDVRAWFDHPVSRPKVPRNWIDQLLDEQASDGQSECRRLRQSASEQQYVDVGGNVEEVEGGRR